MNVLLVSQYLTGGGLERMVHLLGEGLKREFDARIFFYSLDGAHDAAMIADLEKRGMTAIHEPKGPGFSRKTVRRLADLIRRERIDVVHTHESAPLMYATFAKVLSGRRVKIIHTQHSFIHLSTRPYIRYYDRIFQRAAAHVTAVSSQVRDEYEKIGVTKGRIKVIANGVEFPEKQLTPQEKKTLRQALIAGVEKDGRACAPLLAANTNALWLLGLARVHPRKGQDHLIRVWGALPAIVRRRSLLVFVGPETDEMERQRLERILDGQPDRDRVIFVGSTTRPVAWMQASDLYLSGSEYEGMPLSPIEACGAGLPAVLSDIEGHALLAGTARLFPFNEPRRGAEQVAAFVAQLDADPQKFLAEARAKAAEIQARFSIAKMARNFYALYTK